MADESLSDAGAEQRFAGLLAKARELDYTGYSEQYPPVGSWRPLRGPSLPGRAWSSEAAASSSFNLFVNFPFCRSKCDFCFLPVTGCGGSAREMTGDYLRRLAEEAAFYAPLVSGRRCRSLYVGGGTPSLMTVAQTDAFFSLLRGAFDLSAPDQIALELHPENAAPERLRAFARNGVTWACVGVQSLDRGVLKAARRGQRLASVRRAVLGLRAAGIPGVNLDLICGLPGQTPEMFFADVDAAAALRPDEIHLNVFMDTPYTIYSLRGGKKVDGEALERLRDEGFRRLRPLGYRRIDSDAVGLTRLSRNFQTMDLTGRKSILGLGPGAVSRAWGAARYINTVSWNEYRSDLLAGRPPVRLGTATTELDEMAYYAVDRLTYGRRELLFRAFRELFGKEFISVFPAQTRALAAAGARLDKRGLKAPPGLWLTARSLFYSEAALAAIRKNLSARRRGQWPP